MKSTYVSTRFPNVGVIQCKFALPSDSTIPYSTLYHLVTKLSIGIL